MRPEVPAEYRRTLLEKAGLGRFISQPTRIVFRNIERRPVKSLLSVTGISLACAIMIAGRFSKDAVDFMVDVQFRQSHREDMTVTFVDPTSRRALYELMRMRGVLDAEVFRSVPVRLRFGHRSYRTSVEGVQRGGIFRRVLDTGLKPIVLPSSGIVLSDYLGDLLGVRPGDMLTVEVLEGQRPVRSVPVVGLVKQYIGLTGYMDLTALNRLID
jgi:putative ABC transport system permease protein